MITLQELAELIINALLKKLKNFDLRGKEYFDVNESAHFMCISVRYFSEVVQAYGIVSTKVLNKKVYRKSDLIAAIERGSINPMLPR